MALTLDPDDFQELARIRYGCPGAVHFVSASGNDGNVGLSPSTAKASPKTVIEAASPGDEVVIGPGIFALGTGRITIPERVEVRGAGRNRTIITSEHTTAISNSVILELASYCVVRDLKIHGIAASGTQLPVGYYHLSATKSIVDALLYDVDIEARIDAFYFYNAHDTVVRAHRCRAKSKFDTLMVKQAAGFLLELYDAHLIAAGPHGSGNGTETQRCLAGEAGATVRMVGGTMTCTNTGAGPNLASVMAAVDASDGLAAQVYDVAISTSAPTSSGLVLDMYQAGAGSIIAFNTRHDPDKVSGSITIVPTNAVTLGEADSDRIDAIPTVGVGPLTRTITVVDDAAAPVVGASVAMTGGFSDTTDANGQVIFHHTSGSFTINVAKAGYVGATSGSVSLTATGATEIEITAVEITPSADPDRITVYGTTYNGDGSIAVSEPVYFRLSELPAAFVGSPGFEKLTATSDASTAIYQKALIKGAVYLARRDGGKEVTVRVPTTGDSWEVDVIIAGRAEPL